MTTLPETIKLYLCSGSTYKHVLPLFLMLRCPGQLYRPFSDSLKFFKGDASPVLSVSGCIAQEANNVPMSQVLKDPDVANYHLIG